MINEKVKKNIYKILVTVSVFYLFYLYIIPAIFSNEWFVNKACQLITDKQDYSIYIKKPKFKTFITPKFELKFDSIKLNDKEKNIVITQNLLVNFGFWLNKITVNEISADYVFVDVNKILNLKTSNEPEKKRKQGLKTNFYNSVLKIKSSDFIFTKKDKTNYKISANLDLDNRLKDFRPVKFNVKSSIENDNGKLKLLINDNDKIYIKDKTLFIDACPLKINSSEIIINSNSSEQKGLNLEFVSDNFKAADLYELVNSNVIVKNGSTMISSVNDFGGDFAFSFKLTSDDFRGDISLHKVSFKLIPLNNIPITFSNGSIKITPNDINIDKINGFYGKKYNNKLTLEGCLKDYRKNLDASFIVKTNLNNEFARDYLSQTVGVPIELVGFAGTQLVVKMLDNKININLATRLQKGNDVLIDKASLSPKDYDRAINSFITYKDSNLEIEKIDYYISETINNNSKIKPILTVKGLVDCASDNVLIKELGLDIPKPIPSEFFNLFARKSMFAGGKFQGNIVYLNNNECPKIKGNFNAEKIRIPDLRIYLRKGEFRADNEKLFLTTEGKFKRSEFNFKGEIQNKMSYPFIVKDVELALDYVDIEKLFDTMQNNQSVNEKTSDNLEEGKADFDLKNIIIEKCLFKLAKGKYKKIEIGNLNASLTFDKNQILDISARRFDIAEGISSLKVLCDMKNKKYNLKLVAKDVNSDYMAISLLDMKKEITGKASGFVDLYSDASKKLGGQIKFSINNGSIQKVGLAEYLMKFAAIFRNPLVMISPSIITDIVNIPEGEFDKINGELQIKDNIVHLIRIKSASPRLSSYIVGMYNLENNDAILRIYTKFSKKSKGLYGFIRNLSLNSLANRFLSGNNTEANYYAAEIAQIPVIEGENDDCQIFLTKIDGDVKNNNFLSSLKKIK